MVGGVDLDVGRIRAFIRVTEELHFGQAAATLAISQQALSKRIARLQSLLAAMLSQRGGNSVHLTEAAQRFLAPARHTVAAADAAVAAAVGDHRPCSTVSHAKELAVTHFSA
ncbi:LysR family transcriptional regulator [Nocardia sp. 004]|uniref:LysR family transcriptional regulator n=1 Tax=Nocardia sp. 004 TaxID=3385978 RepID=UPI0039A28008